MVLRQVLRDGHSIFSPPAAPRTSAESIFIFLAVAGWRGSRALRHDCQGFVQPGYSLSHTKLHPNTLHPFRCVAAVAAVAAVAPRCTDPARPPHTPFRCERGRGRSGPLVPLLNPLRRGCGGHLDLQGRAKLDELCVGTLVAAIRMDASEADVEERKVPSINPRVKHADL